MIGVVFGCFCPMHQGHLDIINRAKKENDRCVVICCGYDNDRGSGFLELDLRYRLVKALFANDSLVDVLKINDTEIGIDKNWSVENWRPWLNEVHKQLTMIGLGDKKIKIYVSEANYKEELDGFDEDVILCNRDRNISGTMIRENPLKYWNYIAHTFRRVFSHNILIMGTASEGKTTLTQDLGRYYNLPYSYEAGRINTDFKSDEELGAEDFVYNLYEQQKLNKSLIESDANKGVFISDTDNIVTLMYAKEYADNKKFALTKKDYKEILLPLAKMYAKNIRWNKIFVLAPHDNFVDDGIRCMEHSSMDERNKLFKILTDLLDEFNYEYEILDGNYYENYLSVKNYIESLEV